MHLIDQLFDAAPLLALFITVALGYFVGKFKVGRFVLGGIAGTLLVGVAIGQLGIEIDSSIKGIFFALFIYAVGYQGGPQFFHALNRQSFNELASACVMCIVGLACVLVAAWVFGLDRGTAAGLAAGGLTQSAIIGTAGGAISKLGVSPELAKTLETNVAVGYAVTYIFGSLGPIIMATWFFPMVMKWDIREEALKRAKELSGGAPELEPGQFNAAKNVATRFYQITGESSAAGKKTLEIDRTLSDAAVEAVIRGGAALELSEDTDVKADDVVAVTGKIAVMASATEFFGPEVKAPVGFELVEESRDIILTNKAFIGKEVQDVHDALDVDLRHGVFLVSAKRLGRDLPLLPKLQLRRGDELRYVGSPKDLNRVQSKLGYKITAAAITDFIFFGIGMAVGYLIGMVEFNVGGVPVTVGTGGGCLLSGLLFGWLHGTHRRYAALPSGASNFLRDFGLAVFVGIVGISAGPQALVTIKEFGATLFLLGVGVTIIPQIIVFYFSYYVLRIRNPIEALGCLVGGRSANPGFAALLSKAGNATPVVSFTVTYAVANVLLTLWGPLIVGIITKNPTP